MIGFDLVMFAMKIVVVEDQVLETIEVIRDDIHMEMALIE